MDDFGDLGLFDTFTNKQPVPLQDQVVKKTKLEMPPMIQTTHDEQDDHPQTQAYHRVYSIEDMEVKVDNKECLHEKIIPKGLTPAKSPQDKAPAKEYKFQLDKFQKRAVECLEKNESVLVAAHTSAGKTAVAEYAIAMAFREKQRVIYTSPIKALSNQKYRDLSAEFKDVGLITGDVTINQGASCLVMTTEILRNMLYKGSEVTREVQWVIFDEVHYMRDKERGVVWEESIIMMSPNVRYVFLSATIPNAREFAMWIAGIKNQITNVVYTDYRPTPLQHYLFPSGAEGIYMVVDENSQFREDNFQKALAQLSDGLDEQTAKKKKRQTEGADLFKILKMVFEKKFNPVIIFSFSKKEVEGLALSMKQFDLTSEEEKAQITSIFNSAMEVLSEEDKELPQIQMMIPILKRGIGIHHGGLLPIVKEVTEILFQEGCLKALFSTETFSMGLNMPAKTVIFTAVRKYDGQAFRWISGGEYIQMSGRAGRRGIDDRGITILMVDQKMQPEVAKGMLKGVSDPLNSSFHLSYNMLLNSLRIEDIDIEYIVQRSFHQFQNDAALPQMGDKLKQIQAQEQEIEVPQEGVFREIIGLNQQIEQLGWQQKGVVIQAKYILKYLSLGRVVRVQRGDPLVDWGWGVVININQKKQNYRRNEPKSFEEQVIVDVMIHIQPRHNTSDQVAPQPDLQEEGSMEVVAMLLSNIYDISSVRLSLPKILTQQENKQLVKATMGRMLDQFEDEVPLLDPESILGEDTHLLDGVHQRIKVLKQQRQSLRKQVQENMDKKEYNRCMARAQEKKSLGKMVYHLEQQIEEGGRMVLEEDNKCMKRVLRRLNYIDREDITQIKGQVACEISSCDEILVTEAMFAGLFNDMEPNHIAGLLTCLIHDEQAQQDKVVVNTPGLLDKYQSLLGIAENLHKVFLDSKINIDQSEYLASFKPQMMDLTVQWCQGAPFKDLCANTDLFEGSIIRCLRRLDELLKELQDAAKSIGNVALEEKFKLASASLKRGIVFAASLYL